MDRRKLLMGAVTTGIAATASAAALAQQAGQGGQPQPVSAVGDDAGALPLVTDIGEKRGEMLYRKLGQTGEMVSAIGMGGAHIARPPITHDEAIKLMHAAIDRGITFMDNSWDYNEGRSERWMGEALAQGGYRKKVFLMTKIDGRDKMTAAAQIDESLTRLKTDHLDLLQFHEILRFDDPDRVFGEGGALDAALAAKKAGKVRFIGFTGHKDPRIHLYMLDVADRRGFRFDTVQMPLNVMDAHWRSFARLVLPRLVAQQIGVLGMKSMGDKIILKSGAVTAVDCLTYSLSLPTSVVITGIDKPEILDQAFKVTNGFKPLRGEPLATLLKKTEQPAQHGTYELFKSSAHFDTTARHPDWLGPDSPAVQHLAPTMPA